MVLRCARFAREGSVKRADTQRQRLLCTYALPFPVIQVKLEMKIMFFSPSIFLVIFAYNHGRKSWDSLAFLGRFPVHTGPTPPLTPQTMLDACIQNFFQVSTLYRVGGGRTVRKFRKGCTGLRGNREMTEKYEYCCTVPRTFVQDCRYQINYKISFFQRFHSRLKNSLPLQ